MYIDPVLGKFSKFRVIDFKKKRARAPFCAPFQAVTLLMAEILHQLRLVVYPIIYRVSYIPGGAGFQPSTAVHSVWTDQNKTWINLKIISMCIKLSNHILMAIISPNSRWPKTEPYENSLSAKILKQLSLLPFEASSKTSSLRTHQKPL